MQSPYVYQTHHLFNREITKAFAEGSGGQIVPPTSLLDGPAATYGILRGTGDILLECERLGREFYYIDHGYFCPSDHQHGDMSGHYRVTRNAFQAKGKGEHGPGRWDTLDMEMEPWRDCGDHVLVLPMSHNVAMLRGVDPKTWLQDTVATLARHTDRPIMVKPKSIDLTLEEALRDAHCVVGHCSNALVEAVLMGVPAFNLESCAVSAVALQDLSMVEEPRRTDRRQWAYNLAWAQFTLDEFRDGTAWKALHDDFGERKPRVKLRSRG